MTRRSGLLAAAALLAAAGLSFGGPMEIKVASPSFPAGGSIPPKFTCDGEDVSPALSWSGAPAGVKEFAVICDDPDAPRGTFVHWVLWGIPGNRTSLPEGLSPSERLAELGAARQGANGFGKNGYRGPCPPPGKPHRYFFRVYALSAAINAPPGANREQVDDAMKGHILARGELIGTYGR